MADSETIRKNLERVRQRIGEAARRSGRNAEAVGLVAVSKTWPAEVVRMAVDAGELVFGENKVQEAEQKILLLPERLEWHLIGNLQRNKVRKALGLFGTIHGIGSLDLARQTSRIAAEEGKEPVVYLQVNLAGEASKHGFSAEGLRGELEELLGLERLRIAGLMAIPPYRPDPEESRPAFAALRTLRDELERAGGIPLPGLSMGMSGDFEVAIEEGATLVRVGAAIFGARA